MSLKRFVDKYRLEVVLRVLYTYTSFRIKVCAWFISTMYMSSGMFLRIRG